MKKTLSPAEMLEKVIEELQQIEPDRVYIDRYITDPNKRVLLIEIEYDSENVR